MNTSGFLRSYMSRGLEHIKFLFHVLEVMENELQEMYKDITLDLIEQGNMYNIFIIRDKTIYLLQLKKDDIKLLQHKSPYALDEELWSQLKEKGLEFKPYSQYLKYVFGEIHK